jgi:hypothetical protein
MEAGHLVQDFAAGAELALVAAHTLIVERSAFSV